MAGEPSLYLVYKDFTTDERNSDSRTRRRSLVARTSPRTRARLKYLTVGSPAGFTNRAMASGACAALLIWIRSAGVRRRRAAYTMRSAFGATALSRCEAKNHPATWNAFARSLQWRIGLTASYSSTQIGLGRRRNK